MNVKFLKTKTVGFIRLFAFFFIISLFIISSSKSTIYAITPEQKKIFQKGIMYYDVKSSDGCGTTTSIGSGNSNSAGGGGEFNNERVVAFANSPIDSSWGISDATVEQWFLKQAGARSVINRYGLNEGNIGQITSAVKSAGVSVVFFYTHTVNEGGGAGGFINHYKNDAPGGGVGNATKDAQYLKETSNKTGFNPSWIDAGNPKDFVPPNIKEAGNAHFQNNIKTGTIGRVYIAAGAAAAWEVYYPDGLKKEFNGVQNYGQPFNNIINSIVKMGGDPLVSSSTCSGDSSIVGEGIAKVVDWAKKIANNDGYGYGQDTRTTGWAKWQEDPNCVNQCGDFDCSSFLAAAFTVGGFFKTNPQFATINMVNVLSEHGFTKLDDSGVTSDNLQPGDILVKSGHTAMYIGNNQIVHASQNEKGGASGGQAGDQTGKEVTIRSFYNGGWNLGVWRAPK